MPTPGSELIVTPEKAVAGGRMLARHEGRVVLVSGTIPGERVRVRLDRVSGQVSYGETVEVLEPGPDRRRPTAEGGCGGSVFAHIRYPRQLKLKAEIIADAFARIGKCHLATSVPVMSSDERGYRMRARLHVRGGRLGFFREGTHEICDAASTGQLLPAATEAIAQVAASLSDEARAAASSFEIVENVPGDQRAIHLELAGSVGARIGEKFNDIAGLTGLTWSIHGSPAPPRQRAGALGTHARLPRVGPALGTLLNVAYGSPYVIDVLELAHPIQPVAVKLRHHVRSFFQGNRWLLRQLLDRVLLQVPDEEVIELYAGVGLFALPLAASGRRSVVAVESDRSSGSDLVANAAPYAEALTVRQMSVEEFVHRAAGSAKATILLDPPRTGVSREAMSGILTLKAPRVVYVSCDVATLARDVRRFLDDGYRLDHMEAFDLFPNTAHVETLVTLSRGT